MKNIDKKIFDYLTIKENFESSIELVESLQKVQTELIKYFWLDVVEAIKNNFSNENNLINKSWLFEYEIFEDGRGIELLVRHLNDTNGSCYYIVNIDIRIGGKAKMGVYIDNFVIQELDPRKLDIDEKKLSDDGWYINFQANKNGWIINDDVTQYFSINNVSELTDILPKSIEREKEIERVVEVFIINFNESIQSVITKILQLNSINL